MTQLLTLSERESCAFDTSVPKSAEAIATLLAGNPLDCDSARAVFSDLASGSLRDPLIAAVFVALRIRGESANELTGAALALRDVAIEFPPPPILFADSCGTGGDSSGSINVSTASGLIAAAAGLPVVKHGNGSFTSQCGSADVLRLLGVKLDVSPAQSRRILEQTGFCFLFAPLYHPAIAHAGTVRRALKVRTIMNLLGPCLNPALPKVQLVGVPEPQFLRPVAETLRALGTERALVVHGSGLDEIALHGVTQAVELRHGRLHELELTPEQAGLDRLPLQSVIAGSPTENARRLSQLLAGKGDPADEAIVAFNAGALLHISGRASGLRDGVSLALETIRSGAGGILLGNVIEASRG